MNTLIKAANPLSNFRIQICLRHLHIHEETKSERKSQTNCQTLKKKKKKKVHLENYCNELYFLYIKTLKNSFVTNCIVFAKIDNIKA